MTTHTAPMLFVPSVDGFALHLGDVDRPPMVEPRQHDPPARPNGHGEHRSAHRLIAGVCRFLGIGSRLSRSSQRLA